MKRTKMNYPCTELTLILGFLLIVLTEQITKLLKKEKSVSNSEMHLVPAEPVKSDDGTGTGDVTFLSISVDGVLFCMQTTQKTKRNEDV